MKIEDRVSVIDCRSIRWTHISEIPAAEYHRYNALGHAYIAKHGAQECMAYECCDGSWSIRVGRGWHGNLNTQETGFANAAEAKAAGEKVLHRKAAESLKRKLAKQARKAMATAAALLAVAFTPQADADEFDSFNDREVDRTLEYMLEEKAGDRMVWICMERLGRDVKQCDREYESGGFSRAATESMDALFACLVKRVGVRQDAGLPPDGREMLRDFAVCELEEVDRLAADHGIDAKSYPFRDRMKGIVESGYGSIL